MACRQLPSPHCTGSNSGLQIVGNSYFLILPGMMAKLIIPAPGRQRKKDLDDRVNSRPMCAT